MNKCYFIATLLLLTLFVYGKDNNDTTYAKDYNAYSFAKYLLKLEKRLLIVGNDSVSNLELKQSLGKIIWYGNFQDDNASVQIKNLEDSIMHYTTLKNIFNRIKDKLYKDSIILSLKSSDFDTAPYANTITNDAIKNSLKNQLKNKEKIILLIGKTTDIFINVKKSLKLLYDDTNYVFIDSLNMKLVLTSQDSSQFSNVIRLKNNIKSWNDSLVKYTIMLDSLNKKKLEITSNFIEYIASNRTYLQHAFLTSFVPNAVISRDYQPEETSNLFSSYSKASQSFNNIEAPPAAASPYTLSQSAVIDAFAIYLAKRVKQEAVMWFFETLKKNAIKYDLINTFFPSTINLLQSNEAFEIPNLGSQWRYALSNDFIHMPHNVFTSKWFDSTWFGNDNRGQNKIVKSYINSSIKVAELMLQRYSYKDVVKQMYLNAEEDEANLQAKVVSQTDILPKHIFSFLYSINQELFIHDNVKNKSRFLNYEDLKTMNKDELEVMLSLCDMKYGKVYSKFFQIAIGGEFEFAKPEDIRRWIGKIQSAIEKVNLLQAAFYADQAKEDNAATKTQDYKLNNIWNVINDLFDQILPPTELTVNTTPDWLKKGNKIARSAIKASKQTQEIYNQITSKNFAGAVANTINLLENLCYIDTTLSVDVVKLTQRIQDSSYEKNDVVYKIPTILYEVINDRRNTVISKNGKDSIVIENKTNVEYVKKYQNGNANASKLLKFTRNDLIASVVFEKERQAIQVIKKLSGFLNDVALATSDKQLAKVVESNALPPGSYKRKRNSWWSLDLNAFAGGYLGYENAFKRIPAKDEIVNNNYVYGISVPIGLTLSKTFGIKVIDMHLPDDYIRNPEMIRLGKKDIWSRTGHTLSFSISIIDMAAPFSYRFQNTTDSVLPQQIKWAQLISPGAHIAWGIKNTPLVLNMGYEYTPDLRRIDDKEVTIQSQYNAHRIFVGLMFDLPLINIYSKSYIKPYMTESGRHKKSPI